MISVIACSFKIRPTDFYIAMHITIDAWPSLSKIKNIKQNIHHFVEYFETLKPNRMMI